MIQASLFGSKFKLNLVCSQTAVEVHVTVTPVYIKG